MIDPQPPRAWTSVCGVFDDEWWGCGWEPAHPDSACLDSRPSSDRCKAFALQLVLGRANTFIQYCPGGICWSSRSSRTLSSLRLDRSCVLALLGSQPPRTSRELRINHLGSNQGGHREDR